MRLGCLLLIDLRLYFPKGVSDGWDWLSAPMHEGNYFDHEYFEKG